MRFAPDVYRHDVAQEGLLPPPKPATTGRGSAVLTVGAAATLRVDDHPVSVLRQEAHRLPPDKAAIPGGCAVRCKAGTTSPRPRKRQPCLARPPPLRPRRWPPRLRRRRYVSPAAKNTATAVPAPERKTPRAAKKKKKKKKKNFFSARPPPWPRCTNHPEVRSLHVCPRCVRGYCDACTAEGPGRRDLRRVRRAVRHQARQYGAEAGDGEPYRARIHGPTSWPVIAAYPFRDLLGLRAPGGVHLGLRGLPAERVSRPGRARPVRLPCPDPRFQRGLRELHARRRGPHPDHASRAPGAGRPRHQQRAADRW